MRCLKNYTLKQPKEMQFCKTLRDNFSSLKIRCYLELWPHQAPLAPSFGGLGARNKLKGNEACYSLPVMRHAALTQECLKQQNAK